MNPWGDHLGSEPCCAPPGEYCPCQDQEDTVAGKSKALMQAMSDQILRFVEGVRREGGIRRTRFAFPDNSVVVIVLRQSEFEEIGSPGDGKGPHRYTPQQMVHEVCGWCLQPASHPSHAATLKVMDFPDG
jgi:hypothetical protein